MMTAVNRMAAIQCVRSRSAIAQTHDGRRAASSSAHTDTPTGAKPMVTATTARA